ncbi:uncharacterized protein LOC130896470 [Diorhabda carinulata]|uniref:uncharacterized protein LOC130896470 n=1 Tax=Diorhabda carinulata TaxID=1163345 RepID=UPI0025A0C8EF|nr:uncharacterized protein LOC130896470 [Diorhabda carinulata]XP_057660602.1 uncharacterized protein LOC130896470 [Diorhabda carinulata]
MKTSIWSFVVLYLQMEGFLCNIDHLELLMPRYAIKGGDVILRCNHSVPPEQLYKVEWRKSDNKIFQYIKGRKPPFRYFSIPGAELAKTNTSDKQIQLSKLDFSASGSYSCVVSMDTPIFTKDSEMKDLTIIEPQNYDPKITFNKNTYEIGEILEANCTTAPSRPPPHITWLINNEKVPDKLTKSYSNGMIHGYGYFDQKAVSIKQLSIEVSDLHVGDDGQLTLTCMSTIPGYVNSLENYADLRTAIAHIDIELTEGPVGEAISNMTPNATSWKMCLNFSLFSLSLFATSLM